MFVFSLDASEQVEREVGNYYDNFLGDCHLNCLCYIFFDLEDVDGSLYVVEKAICVVTVSPQYLPLMYEMINHNIRLLNNERLTKMNHLFERHIENTPAEHYSKEIQASLQVRYESPPQSIQFLIESVRSYKLDHQAESYGGEFSKIELKDFQTKENTI